jgi:hypothetical protein
MLRWLLTPKLSHEPLHLPTWVPRSGYGRQVDRSLVEVDWSPGADVGLGRQP